MQKHGLLNDPESQKLDAINDMTHVTDENVDNYELDK